MKKYQTVVTYNRCHHMKESLPNLIDVGDILVEIRVQKNGDPVPEKHVSFQSVIFSFDTEKEAYKQALEHCVAEYNHIKFDADVDKKFIISKIEQNFPELLI